MTRWRFLTWVILFFNALMLFLVILLLATAADNCDGLTGTRLESCETGTAVGATIGTGLIVFFWVGGSVILGLIWLVTNKKARDCPACGRHVKRGRTTCRKCGHDFAPAQTASPSIPPPPPPQTPSSPPVKDDGGDGSDKPPFWRRRWVLITGGILIVLIVITALTDTSGDDESDTVLELAAAEDEPDESPATPTETTATTSESRAATTTEAPLATLGDAAPATPTETTATTSESRAATTTEAPLVGESSLDSPIQLGAVVQAGSWRLRVSAITPDGTDEVMEENQFNDPPPEGNQFFIASLEATYTGTESSTFWADMTLKSVGDSRVAYEGIDGYCGVIPDNIDDSGETFPGGTVTGNVCWSIQSTDAASLVMIVEESFNFDDDTRAFLSLDPTATPINETTSLEEGRESGFESAVAIGESATVGGWELKVVAITPDGTDEVMEENRLNDPPPEGNQFFIASLEATYTGTESSTFWIDMRLKSVGDSRVAYEGIDAYCGVIPDNINDSGETFPGGTVTGNVCWSIQSTDAASLVMIVEESFNFGDDTRAFFALAN